MNKFTITMIVLVIAIVGTLFYLEVPYENNYAAQMGDTVKVSYTVTDANGTALVAEEAKSINIIIGSDSKPQDFEAQLVGMKREETKEIAITYPSDYYDATLQNQQRIYTVTVNDIEKCSGSLESCGAVAEHNRQNPDETEE